MRPAHDLARELTKVADTVDTAVLHFRSQAQADAALHMNPVVRPNPLTVAVEAASADLHRLITELEEVNNGG